MWNVYYINILDGFKQSVLENTKLSVSPSPDNQKPLSERHKKKEENYVKNIYLTSHRLEHHLYLLFSAFP